MAGDVFGYMGWLHYLGLLETSLIVGLGRGMVSLSVNGTQVFDKNKRIE